MAKFKYTIDGKDYEVEIAEVKDNVAEVTVNGDTFSVELPAKEEPKKEKPVLGQPVAEAGDNEVTSAANVNAAGAVKAPLPGTITSVHVAVGDEVSAGDTVVVLEAMKMQNNIEAENGGKVTAICVKQGQAVLEEDVLVVIE